MATDWSVLNQPCFMEMVHQSVSVKFSRSFMLVRIFKDPFGLELSTYGFYPHKFPYCGNIRLKTKKLPILYVNTGYWPYFCQIPSKIHSGAFCVIEFFFFFLKDSLCHSIQHNIVIQMDLEECYHFAFYRFSRDNSV